MKIKMTQPILDFSGTEFKGPDGNPETLREIITRALSAAGQGEVLTSDLKSKIYAVGIKLWSKNQVDLTSEEITLIKQRVDSAYGSPVIYGRIDDILEGRNLVPAAHAASDAEAEPPVQNAAEQA
jgi:hypothetical protein